MSGHRVQAAGLATNNRFLQNRAFYHFNRVLHQSCAVIPQLHVKPAVMRVNRDTLAHGSLATVNGIQRTTDGRRIVYINQKQGVKYMNQATSVICYRDESTSALRKRAGG